MNVHALMNHVLVNCQVQNVLTKLMTKKMMEQEKMKKNKPRWKDLPFYERFARTCKRNGSADWMVEHIRERGKQKEVSYIQLLCLWKQLLRYRFL